MRTRTKIICTMGPAVAGLDKVMALMGVGMNVARLNLSHGDHKQHAGTIADLKEARKRLNQPLAIMLDTKGPEIRLGKLAHDGMELMPGHRWTLVAENIVGDLDRVTVTPPSVIKDLEIGATVLFDDGYIKSQVVEKEEGHVVVQIENGGTISSHKGVNTPDVNVDLPSVTDKDVEDIIFGCQQDVDIVAASFVRCADHVVDIKRILEEQGKSDIQVVAKIENAEGVKNFDDILQVADGIMIARGDLGVELPLSQVPALQKSMIRKCYLAGKPAITATQMLESMIHYPRPTRAEASDVFNAIFDSTSAVMLSGETAVGAYPVETVRMMRGIIEEAESNLEYQALFEAHGRYSHRDVPSSITMATVNTAYGSGAKAIFAFSASGSTARMLARLRPEMPIVALTPLIRSYHQLSLCWGVIPFVSDEPTDVRHAFNLSSRFALEQGLVAHGDMVVLTAGSPFGISGTTNMMMVESIGEVLVRGSRGRGRRAQGKVVIVLSPERVKPYMVKGNILVLPKAGPQFQQLIEQAAGIILQAHVDDEESNVYLEEAAISHRKPVIFDADGALTILKQEQLVTMDPEKALVYKGIVL